MPELPLSNEQTAVLSDPNLAAEILKIPASDPKRKEKATNVITRRYPAIRNPEQLADACIHRIDSVEQLGSPPPRISETARDIRAATARILPARAPEPIDVPIDEVEVIHYGTLPGSSDSSFLVGNFEITPEQFEKNRKLHTAERILFQMVTHEADHVDPQTAKKSKIPSILNTVEASLTDLTAITPDIKSAILTAMRQLREAYNKWLSDRKAEGLSSDDLIRYSVERAQLSKPALSKIMHLIQVFQSLLAQNPQVKTSLSDLQKAYVDLHNAISPGMPGMGERNVRDHNIVTEKIPTLTDDDLALPPQGSNARRPNPNRSNSQRLSTRRLRRK